MDSVQPRISLIYTTNNEKKPGLVGMCSKKIFQNHISGFVANFAGFAHIPKYTYIAKSALAFALQARHLSTNDALHIR